MGLPNTSLPRDVFDACGDDLLKSLEGIHWSTKKGHIFCRESLEFIQHKTSETYLLEGVFEGNGIHEYPWVILWLMVEDLVIGKNLANSIWSDFLDPIGSMVAWHMYLHLPYKSIIHVGKYISPMGSYGPMSASQRKRWEICPPGQNGITWGGNFSHALGREKHIHMYMLYMYIYIYTCGFICTYIKHIYVYTHIYTHIHIYIYLKTHTYTY